ncbi:MAG: resD [Frankiales bacterium]|nr:resD [Frankiales bacterium]
MQSQTPWEALVPVRLLVVDDDPSLRRLFELLGNDHPGIDGIDTAADGPSALASAHRLPPDGIVLDADLRGADGLALIPSLQLAGPDAVVVVFSSAPYADDTQARRAGADAFVEKGTDPEVLLTRVIDLVDRRRAAASP